jgi:hypothetical protein
MPNIPITYILPNQDIINRIRRSVEDPEVLHRYLLNKLLIVRLRYIALLISRRDFDLERIPHSNEVKLILLLEYRDGIWIEE